jgi:uncharacterized protein with von Willebrand factor type A (vWA) domain
VSYPFTSLPENLAAFCAALRQHHHFTIGPRELTDAAHALELADIAVEREVRDVLRPVLSKNYDEARTFDQAFDRFFHRTSVPRDVSPRGVDTLAGAPDDAGAGATDARPSGHEPPALDGSNGGTGAGAVHEIAEEEDGADAALLRASYSPLEAEGGPLILEPPTRPWIEAAAALAARLRAATSRRWQPAPRGPRFDFRRTLRNGLRTGGEPLTPRWRAHHRRSPRFVLLIDGSRSMGAATPPLTQMAVALSAVSRSTETFAFSTSLRRVTRDVRRAAAGERRAVGLRQAWGGGTSIGACLDDFLRRYGERLLGRETVVIVASDGLDVGDPDLLRQSMAAIARRSAANVWINPLAATAGYEPIAAGMHVARPFVTLLTTVGDAPDLMALARALRR